MGVEGNCSSISQGGEVDSTGLRTQTANITPRTRCVPPETLISATTAKTQSAKTGSRLVPRFGFLPETPISRWASFATLFWRMAFPPEKCALGVVPIVFTVVAL
jgi:hypothetical protein